MVLCIYHSLRDVSSELTFISLNKGMLESTGSEEKGEVVVLAALQSLFHLCAAMVGDVNLFLNECDEEENEDNGKLSEEAKDSGAGATTPMSSPCYDAEISVMIAVKEARRQGLASEAVKGIVLYGKAYHAASWK